MSCDKTVSQFECNDIDADLLNNTDFTIDSNVATFFSNFGCLLDEDDFIDSNENLVIETDGCINLCTTPVNNNIHMTNSNYALTSSSKDDFISNQDNFTEQYNTETKCNGYANTGMTLLHTDATEPIAPTIVSADEFESNKQNHTAQIQSNEGGQQILHENIEVNASNPTAFASDTKAIDSEIRQCVLAYCTKCGVRIWCHIHLKNRICPNCFDCTLDEDGFVNSNGKIVVPQTDECISIDTNMTDPNYALTSSSKDDSISNQDNFTEQYKTETKCNGHANTGMTLLHTDATEPIAPTIISADEFDSNKQNHIAQMQSNEGGQQILHENIEANAFNPTAFSYDTKAIDNGTETGKFIVIYCTNCGDTQFNHSYLRNRKCPICCTKRTLRCAKCRKQYDKYNSIYEHLRRKCHPKMLYQCSRCGHNTHDKWKMERHLNIQRHNSPKDITCKGRANTEANASNPTAFAYDAKIIDSVTVSQFDCDDVSFWKDDFILNKAEVTSRNNIEARYNEYINNVEATTLSYTDILDRTASSFCSADDFDSNKDGFSVQSLNDIGGDQYLHTNIEANPCNAVASTSNAYVIGNGNDTSSIFSDANFIETYGPTIDSFEPTIFSADECDSNKENLIGQTQSNVGGHQDVLLKNIVANPSDDTASTAAGTLDLVSDIFKVAASNAVEKRGRQDDAVLRLSKLMIIYCKNCRHSSPWKNNYRKNMYCLSCNTKRSVRCRTCGYECYAYQTMRFHLTQNCLMKEYIALSRPAKKFKCPVCLEMFSKTYLDAHPCKVRCPACSKMFANRRTLKYHEDHSCPKFSYDGNRISCPDCGNVLKNKKVLSSHKSKNCKGKSAQVRNSF